MPKTEHDPTAQWTVYEANVQAYRGLSISSQSILLAVGAILLDRGQPGYVMAILAALAVGLTWLVWSRVILARVRIADFHKFRLDLKFEDGGAEVPVGKKPSNPLNESTYVKKRSIRRKIYKALNYKTMRLSRVKLDVVVPAVFSLIWTGFVVLSCVGGA